MTIIDKGKKTKELFDKAQGGVVLKQSLMNGSFVRVCLAVLANGFSRKGLEVTHLSMNACTRRYLSKHFSSFANSARERIDSLALESAVVQNKNVWSLWLQGEDQAPDIIQKCIASQKRWLSEYNYILLTSDNLNQYVEFPEHISRKIANGTISKTHLSDLVRLELLTKYGGTWLDASVYLSGVPSGFMLDSNLFVFQALKPASEGKSCVVSSWFMTAQAPSKILLLTKELLYEYWRRYDRMADYFLIHYFLQMSLEIYSEDWKSVVPASSGNAHALQMRLFDDYEDRVISSVFEQIPVHKLTYKFKNENISPCSTLSKLLSGDGVFSA